EVQDQRVAQQVAHRPDHLLRERQRAKERALPIHRAELQVVGRLRGRLAVAVGGDVAQEALALQPLHFRADGGGLPSIEERRHGNEAALARYREVLEQRLANEPRTLNEIEQAVEEIGQVMEDDLERRLLERKERPAIPEDNQAACPRCGRWGRYRATEAR